MEPELCPICGNPIPKRRYRMTTCGNLLCTNAMKSIVRKKSCKNGDVIGIDSNENFDKVRKELHAFFSSQPYKRYRVRQDFEEWILERGNCRDISSHVLKKAITCLLVHENFNCIPLRGKSGRRQWTTFMFHLPGEKMEAGVNAIASDS